MANHLGKFDSLRLDKLVVKNNQVEIRTYLWGKLINRRES